MPETTIAEFLFELPEQPLTRQERILALKQFLHRNRELTQEDLDKVMARLLKEIQR